MKTRAPNLNSVFVVLILVAVVIGVARFVLAAAPNQARVTEVIRDVRLLPARAAARPAAVNDTILEGTAVRTGAESRAELTFADQTLTRLGANTVFSFGIGARSYDLENGAILMTAPRERGTVKISTKVATCAISGFYAIFEAHSKNWNKVLVLEGDGDVSLKNNPNDHRYMHSWQILVFPWNATVLPQPQEFDVCKVISDGLLINGFKNPLQGMPTLVAECDKQKSQPPTTNLVDPTNQNIIDQSVNARPPIEKPPPLPSLTPPPGDRPR